MCVCGGGCFYLSRKSTQRVREFGGGNYSIVGKMQQQRIWEGLKEERETG